MNFRDFQSPGRSVVYARNGMAATSQPLATQAAIAVLAAGGNAVDAAVTAIALQTVVEPHMVSIGGDCFALVAEPDGEVYGLNSSGRSPQALTADIARQAHNNEIPATSAHAVSVPGAVRGFECLIDRFGTWGLDRALSPAIDAAEEGFIVTPRVGWDWGRAEEKLRLRPNTAAAFLPGGKSPQVGDVVRFPALAKSLRTIAEQGSAGLYTGWIADDLVEAVAGEGGLLDAEDLQAHSADWVAPISRSYRGHEILELPPNGQGAFALMILGILEHFDMSDLGPTSGERYHLLIEAARAAYSVRDRELADPDQMRVAVEDLIGDTLAADLAGQIDPKRRNETFDFTLPKGTDTVFVTVADKEGRIVSLIASLFADFGSAIVGRESGILLHNRGSGFSLEAGHPNCLEPGRRPLHTLIPGLIRKQGRIVSGFGVMGGQYQAAGHSQILSNLIDYGMDPQQALDWPRVFFDESGAVQAESGIPRAAKSALSQMGHRLVLAPKPLGGGQVIVRDWDRGVLAGGSDPRKDGCAIGY